MRRAFISLYGLIVFSLLLFGWGLDRVWQFYSPAKDSNVLSPEVFSVLNYFLADSNPSDQKMRITELATQLKAQISLMQVDDFVQTAFAERIKAGELTVVNGANGKHYYQKLTRSSTVISWVMPETAPQRSFLYETLVVAFYVLIALVILLWIWPLSRDLAKLEKQTKVLGYDSTFDNLHISQTSAVYDLASSFNRMAQRIRDLLTTQKEMTYAVSHELRTPLARMKFGLEMASAASEISRVKEKLAGVREDVSEMDLLVNQLLAYAEFDQNRRELDFQAGDLGALIKHLMTRINDKNGRIQFVFENTSPSESVYCEWYLMERALINLFQNAQRFAASRVNVQLAFEDGYYQIIVDDDGRGIPEIDCARVFQSFVRLNNSVNSENRGFGLGLSIVQRIMSWHGGSAAAEKSPIGGARLILSWPIREIGNVNTTG